VIKGRSFDNQVNLRPDGSKNRGSHTHQSECDTSWQQKVSCVLSSMCCEVAFSRGLVSGNARAPLDGKVK
jgi:hypothetical protein